MDEKEKQIEAEVLESKENVNKNEEKIEKKDKKTDIQKQAKNDDVENKVKEEKKEIIEEKKIEDKKQEEKKVEDKKTEGYEFKKSIVHKKSNKPMIIVAILSILLILGLLVSTIFALINSNNQTILSGIYVRGTLIEGLTEEQAISLLNEKFAEEIKKEILLNVNGETFSITPEQIEVQYDVEKAVKNAYEIGRNGNIFQNNFAIIRTMMEENKFGVEISYNEDLLKNVLEGFNAKIPNSMVDNTYCIEDNELIITRGIDGIVIDIESAKETIVNTIKEGNIQEIELKTVIEKCPEIDIEKIYSEVKSEPQNASYKTNPYEIIPHKYGIDFDIEEAKQIISEEKEEYVIKLNLIEPEILTNEIGEEAFPDLLGAFSTKYDESNVSRSKNVKLAASKLNGVVVMPGEVFSYNKTLGKRTAEAGYEYANGFAGGKVVPMLAGGICQVSSTLYDAVLYANLNIVERYNHMFQATYVEPGKDATVVYGSLDFKFENTRSYPIMLKTSASGGLLTVKVFGIKEEIEYEVKVVTEVLSYTPYKVVYETDNSLAAGQEKVSQWGLQGCKSITYRILSLNGQQVSKEVLSTDTYDPLSKIIKKGPKKATKPTVNTSAEPVEPEKTPVTTEPENTEKEENETTNKPQTTDKPETIDKETNKPETTEKPETADKETNKPETTEKPDTTDKETDKTETNNKTEQKEETTAGSAEQQPTENTD